MRFLSSLAVCLLSTTTHAQDDPTKWGTISTDMQILRECIQLDERLHAIIEAGNRGEAISAEDALWVHEVSGTWIELGCGELLLAD